MSGYLVSEEFVKEHREMLRWYRSQLPSTPLRAGKGRNNRSQGLVPFVLTESLDGSTMTATARKLGRSSANDSAQIISVGQSADDGTFTLTDGTTTTASIDHDASKSTMQSEMDTVFGAGNTLVYIGEGVWLVRFIGNLSGSLQPLLTADSSKLSGSEQVGIQQTMFSAELGEFEVFNFMTTYKNETLPAGTFGYAYHYPGIGYGIVNHNRVRPSIIMYGQGDANIASGATGTVSVYRGTQDTAANVSVENITDQQIDSGAKCLIVELVDENGDLYYGAMPLECPA